jgi:hypothetical protein
MLTLRPPLRASANEFHAEYGEPSSAAGAAGAEGTFSSLIPSAAFEVKNTAAVFPQSHSVSDAQYWGTLGEIQTEMNELITLHENTKKSGVIRPHKVASAGASIRKVLALLQGNKEGLPDYFKEKKLDKNFAKGKVTTSSLKMGASNLFSTFSNSPSLGDHYSRMFYKAVPALRAFLEKTPEISYSESENVNPGDENYQYGGDDQYRRDDYLDPADSQGLEPSDYQGFV